MENSMLGEAGFFTSIKHGSMQKMIEVVKEIEPEMGYGMIMQVSEVESPCVKNASSRLRPSAPTAASVAVTTCGPRAAKFSKIEPGQGDANAISTCVKGKFGWDYVNHRDRPQKPLIREGSTFREATWEEALPLVATRLNAIKDGDGARFARRRHLLKNNERRWLHHAKVCTYSARHQQHR